MKKLFLICIILLVFVASASATDITLGVDSTEVIFSDEVIFPDSVSVSYVINPNSKEKHQLNVKIQFNAITYDTMLDIMNQIKTSYGKNAVTDEKKACSIKFIIDGN